MVADPGSDPHQSENSDLDPNQSEKRVPDPSHCVTDPKHCCSGAELILLSRIRIRLTTTDPDTKADETG
jgi:hypothetical protein